MKPLMLIAMFALTACENRYGHEVHYVSPSPVTEVSTANNCIGGGCR